MSRRLLVVSTVHPSDDPRIRHKLIATLQQEWDVTFAGKGRGPVDQRGLNWRELNGGRVRRWFGAGRLLVRSRYDVASIHDPELLPLGIVASLLGRKVVFDVHENVPGQLRTKEWLPRLVRRPLAVLSRWLLRVGEKRLEITLAESGYQKLFADEHPVFPNYLAGDLPEPKPANDEVGIVYLGDVTEARGLAVVVEAAAQAGTDTFTIMGRCAPALKARLLALAATTNLKLVFRGFVRPTEALRVAAAAQLGLSPLLDTPNYRQSLPTKVLEYLAVGLPTLASDLPGTREVVGDKPGVVLVEPGDVAAWSKAIRSASDDVELRLQAQQGVPEILALYMWPSAAVAQFYRSLVAD